MHVVDGHVVAPRVARPGGRDRPADPRLSRAEISSKLSARSSKNFGGAARLRGPGADVHVVDRRIVAPRQVRACARDGPAEASLARATNKSRRRARRKRVEPLADDGAT